MRERGEKSGAKGASSLSSCFAQRIDVGKRIPAGSRGLFLRKDGGWRDVYEGGKLNDEERNDAGEFWLIPAQAFELECVPDPERTGLRVRMYLEPQASPKYPMHYPLAFFLLQQSGRSIEMADLARMLSEERLIQMPACVQECELLLLAAEVSKCLHGRFGVDCTKIEMPAYRLAEQQASLSAQMLQDSVSDIQRILQATPWPTQEPARSRRGLAEESLIKILFASELQPCAAAGALLDEARRIVEHDSQNAFALFRLCSLLVRIKTGSVFA